MAICPKCKANMVAEDKRMICPNLACPYQGYDLPKPILSYEELLQEIERLKADRDFYKKMWLQSPEMD